MDRPKPICPLNFSEVGGIKSKSNKKQMQFCSNLLMLQMGYDKSVTSFNNPNNVITVSMSISQSSSEITSIGIA